jgi:hypothetical protein
MSGMPYSFGNLIPSCSDG